MSNAAITAANSVCGFMLCCLILDILKFEFSFFLSFFCASCSVLLVFNRAKINVFKMVAYKELIIVIFKFMFFFWFC